MNAINGALRDARLRCDPPIKTQSFLSLTTHVCGVKYSTYLPHQLAFPEVLKRSCGRELLGSIERESTIRLRVNSNMFFFAQTIPSFYCCLIKLTRLGLLALAWLLDTRNYIHIQYRIMANCVNFVTGNANKLREVKAMLEPGIEVRSHPLDIEEVQGTITEVTESKCRKAAGILNGPVLVEDTALCFNALAGLPGPYM